MAYLMLYGTGGWTQRWQIPVGDEEKVQAELTRVGHEGTGHLEVVDSQTGGKATLMVAWQAVAAAVIVDSEAPPGGGTSTGQYA
jgi:hypothetical protein